MRLAESTPLSVSRTIAPGAGIAGANVGVGCCAVALLDSTSANAIKVFECICFLEGSAKSQ
jgi:hypothetical protein